MRRLRAATLAAALAVPLSAVAETPEDQLVVGMSMNNVLTFDPAAVSGREATQIVTNIYDTLVHLDPKERSTVHPALAESWDIAEDASSVSFILRDDAVFASGNPVEMEDVLWSLRRNIELGLVGAGIWKSYGYTLENFDDLVTAEGSELTVELAQPGDPRMILYMFGKPDTTSVIDKEKALAHEVDGDLAQGWLATNSAGSGPFTLATFNANDLILLERNENYWDEAPAMRRVVFRHMPESQTKRLMIERGDIDVALALSVPDLRALESNEDVEIQNTPSAGFYYLAVNMKQERFQNRELREALRYLIDYQGINETIMPNYGVPRQRPVALNIDGSLPDPGYELDVEHAKELLAEAGYADGFEAELLALNEPPFLDIATAVQATMAEAGVDLEISTGGGSQVYGPMRERNFDMIVGRGGGGQEPHPHSNLRALIVNPDNSDDAGLSGVIVWRTGFYNEELNQVAQEALMERDPEQQAEMYEDIQRRIDEIVPSLQPISAVVDSVAVRADVEGYVNHYGWTTRLDEVSKER